VEAVLEITRLPGDDGMNNVQVGGDYEKGKTIALPRVTLSVEHFGLVARLLERNVPVEVEMKLETKFYDDDPMSYNTVAEIPVVAPSLKDQVGMPDEHLDSWHASEGTTDNGAGVIVAMEVVRLLEKLGVQPRRTIGIALWSGEEQGLYGSAGYVKERFGSRPVSTDPQYKD
jgi:carboxypeptidase Q